MSQTYAYDQKLEEQKTQYKGGEEIHDLPPIFHYWSHNYLRPRMEEVFGVSTVGGFYAKGFAEQVTVGPGQKKFVSIGSGDSSYEIEVAELLLAKGFENFEIQCLEVRD